MKTVKIKLLDSFSETLFGGNVAGVVTEADGLNTEEMQKIASEINITTSGFVSTRGENEFRVRFFTPTQEVNMCGHVVVGVTTALAQEGKINRLKQDDATAKLYTNAGEIPVTVFFDGETPSYVLMQQNKPSFKSADVHIEEVARLLGITSEVVEKKYPIEIASTALRHLLVPIKNLGSVQNLKPNFNGLAELSHRLGVETVDVFTLETINRNSTVHSRDFCPGVGYPEASASGTTNGALSSYLIKNKIVSAKENDLVRITIEQGYEMGRPSNIKAEIKIEENKIEEVKIGGSAVLSLAGEIYLP